MKTPRKGANGRDNPNSTQEKPIIGFRSNLSPLAMAHIKRAAACNDKARFINQAIEMRYHYEMNPEKFIKTVLQENYRLARFLLRKIGRTR